MELAKHNLFHSVGDLAVEMNTQLVEPRYTQYLDNWNDAAEEVTEVADVITGAVDEDGVPTPQAEDARRLRENYASTVWSIGSLLVEFKADVQTALAKEQHEEAKKVFMEKMAETNPNDPKYNPDAGEDSKHPKPDHRKVLVLL